MFAGGSGSAGGARRRAGQLGLVVVVVASAWALIAAVGAGARTSGSGSELTAETPTVPTITGVTPTRGAVGGGTKVRIFGTGLTGATAVTFGSVPARTFAVVSDKEITATAPRQVEEGIYPVVVKTPAGETPVGPNDQFAAQGCEVLNVQGLTLKEAKIMIRAGACSVGKISKKPAGKSKRGLVLSQNPKAGTQLERGGKVAIKVGK